MEHSPEFVALVDDAKQRVVEITPDELQALREPHRLLDVREDDEWRGGSIAGAEHLGKGVIERDIRARVPDKGELLVLYCGGGYRSALAADALQKMGYHRVRSLSGGWKAWIARGLPVQK
jgi:rhodanese-related sulfurtransferase